MATRQSRLLQQKEQRGGDDGSDDDYEDSDDNDGSEDDDDDSEDNTCDGDGTDKDNKSRNVRVKTINQNDIPVLVKDPDGRTLADLLVAALGPDENAESIAIKYRDTMENLWRLGRLYVTVHGAEKRIPFSDDHAFPTGVLFRRQWKHDEWFRLWLHGKKWGPNPPIFFRVYTDRQTRRNITSVAWNGRHASAWCEAEFEQQGGRTSVAANPNPPPQRARTPAAAATTAASTAAVKRSIRVGPGAVVTSSKQQRVASSTSVDPSLTRTRRRVARGNSDAASCAIWSVEDGDGVISDNVTAQQDGTGRRKPPLFLSGESEPEPDKPMSAPYPRHAAAAAETLLQGRHRVKEEPPKEFVLKSKDGTSLAAEFQRRAAEYQRRHANACPGFVYEETMEQLLKEGRVYAFTRSTGPTDKLTKLFTRKAMTDNMENEFFAGRTWNRNELELRLAERTDFSSNQAVTPRIFISTATGDRRDVLIVTWNGIHLTNESEILFT